MLTPINPNYIYGTWIIFVDRGIIPGGKTKLTEVWTRQGDDSAGIKLGTIKWFGRFRKYSWFPEPGTVYEEVCNQEITNFLRLSNIKHKEAKKCERLNTVTVTA